MPVLDSLELLRLFSEAKVDFVLVGGVATVLHGSNLLTQDLDLVYSKEEANLDRILPLLKDLKAIFRGLPGKFLAPTRRDLQLNRVNLLKTRLGFLDLLPSIGNGWTFQDLLPRSRKLAIDSFEVHLLSLEAIIESKRVADRPKDRLAILHLQQLLDRENP